MTLTNKQDRLRKSQGISSRWLESARDLYAASGLVWPAAIKTYRSLVESVKPGLGSLKAGSNRRYERGYFLLFGSALENLLKGIIVADDPGLFAGATKYPRKLKTHNLVELARMANVYDACSLEEQQLCQQTSMYLDWAARYHTPLEMDRVRPVFSVMSSDNRAASELFTRWETLLAVKIARCAA